MYWILDILAFVLLTVPCVWLLTISNNIALSFIIAVSCGVFGWLICSKKAFEHKPSWLNWFEISKFFGGMAGILLISYCRYYETYSHYLTLLVLGINIGEAVLSDILTAGYFNALAGFVLFLNTPRPRVWTELGIFN